MRKVKMLKSKRTEAARLYQEGRHKKKKDLRTKAYAMWEDAAKGRKELKNAKTSDKR